MELRVDGVTIAFRTWGSPDRPPLVLMHSTSFGAWMWEPVARLLDSRFYVVATDQPGHGDSDPAPDDGWDFRRFAAYLKQALDEIGVRNPVGVGHSSGSTTLMLCEVANPGTFARLLLIEPILPLAGGLFQPANNPMAEAARRRRPGFPSSEAMVEAFRERPPFNTWTEEALLLYAAQGTRPAGEGVVLKCLPEHEARFYEAIVGVDTSDIGSLSCRVSLVQGERSDGMRGGMFKRAQEMLPDADVLTVPGAGHFIPQEQPATVARMIEEFAAGA
jgi:pimeloyl-ACP methyl ester carboxylesterase